MRTLVAVLLLTLSTLVEPVSGQSLRGSSSSVLRMHEQAVAHDFTFIKDSRGVNRFVQLGLLTELRGNANYTLHAVSYPMVRPETKLLVERLSQQFHSACGEKLIVTSATRPTSNQPRNASQRSVHPTGMAVDLRVPRSSGCRAWLEANLLTLERRQVLEATRENYPPHYHVAVFPSEYATYVAAKLGGATTHKVGRGDTLSELAVRYSTTVKRIQAANGLGSSTRIRAGQTLRIPR